MLTFGPKMCISNQPVILRIAEVVTKYSYLRRIRHLNIPRTPSEKLEVDLACVEIKQHLYRWNTALHLSWWYLLEASQFLNQVSCLDYERQSDDDHSATSTANPVGKIRSMSTQSVYTMYIWFGTKYVVPVYSYYR